MAGSRIIRARIRAGLPKQPDVKVDFPIVADHCRPLPNVDDHCNLSDCSLVRLYKMVLLSIMICRCLLDSELKNHMFSR
jgi:hypothetical protein